MLLLTLPFGDITCSICRERGRTNQDVKIHLFDSTRFIAFGKKCFVIIVNKDMHQHTTVTYYQVWYVLSVHSSLAMASIPY